MHCVFSPLAEQDLKAIRDYIARDNSDRAVQFICKVSRRLARYQGSMAAISPSQSGQ